VRSGADVGADGDDTDAGANKAKWASHVTIQLQKNQEATFF
jgi:hypothetical protein